MTIACTSSPPSIKAIKKRVQPNVISPNSVISSNGGSVLQKRIIQQHCLQNYSSRNNTTVPYLQTNNWIPKSSIQFVSSSSNNNNNNNTQEVEEQSRQKNNNIVTKKKTVDFAIMATVHRVQYTDEDLYNAWYQNIDYNRFELDTKSTLHVIQSVNCDLLQINSNIYTITGLEKNLYLEQTIRRKIKTRQYIRFVLEHQHLDPVQLQHVSEFFSKSHHQRAHLRGILDRTLLAIS